MKKILFGFIVLLSLFVIRPEMVNAEPTYNISGKLVINWIDYGNKFNTRPDSLTYVFLDEYTDDTVTKTFYAKDAVIESTPTTTTWTFDASFLGEFDFSKFIVWDNDEVEGYRKQYSSGGAIGDGQTQINMYYITDFEKNITYTEHWDDGGGRDNDRAFALEMAPINNDRIEIMRLTCGRDEEKYIDANTCQEVIKIPYLYPVGPDGVPIWEEETQFEYKIVDRFSKDYDYRVEVDDNGNIDVYIKHDPYRLDDSSILITWVDSNDKNKRRPTNLTLELYNHKTKEQTIEVTKDDDWNKVLTDLYVNYDTNIVPSEYSLKVANSDDYEFEVTGDTTNGFVINAIYIGEDIVTDESDTNEENSNINEVNSDLNSKNVSNPKTSDNIMIYIIMFTLSIIGIIGSTNYLKHKNI